MTKLTDERIQEIFDSIANDDPDVHIRFARAIEAEAIAAQKVVAWQYQWVYPGTTNTEWYALDLKGETIEEHVDDYCKHQLVGNPKYQVRALFAKETI